MEMWSAKRCRRFVPIETPSHTFALMIRDDSVAVDCCEHSKRILDPCAYSLFYFWSKLKRYWKRVAHTCTRVLLDLGIALVRAKGSVWADFREPSHLFADDSTVCVSCSQRE